MTATECTKAVNEAFKDFGLLRPTPETLATVSLPMPSREFLLYGGLPVGDVFGFDFAPTLRMSTVREYVAARRYPSVDSKIGEGRCIGDSWGTLMVLDGQTWNVRWIDTRGEHAVMFVNSNVESLGASLAAYAALAPLRRTLQPAQLAARFEQSLRRIDAASIEGWRSTVVQEVGFGLS
jgi:hypothetical protein